MSTKRQIDNFVMVGEAARMLKRSVEMVRKYERAGKLPAIRVNKGHRLFRESDVRKLATELEARAERLAS